MAIVQVSRITNRKGLTENLPQLAGAELGWAIDSRRLFIGNGTLEAGAPVIGNTEILTEFSDVVALSNYTYKDLAVGYAPQTGTSVSEPVIRTVQERLDDFATVRAFGAVGDGVADDTVAINRALFQLYCVQANTAVRRSLFFPAGTYRVTGTLDIPSYAKLVGEGANSTIFLLDNSSTANYLARYADSLGQTGVNIGNNGATPPRNIEISGITFQTAAATDIFLVETATQCYFDSCNFIGPLSETALIPVVDPVYFPPDIAAVRFSSTVGLVCRQITLDKCSFFGITYGINTSEQIESVTVSNSRFERLYQGIVLGTGTVINGGATGFRAVGNMFDRVFLNGIQFGDVVLNISAYNVFYDVANGYTGSPTAPVVLISNDNNVSMSDMFTRTDFDANTQPRVRITGNSTNTTTQIQLGRYTRQSGKTFNLINNQTDQPIFTLDPGTIKAATVNYTVVRGTAVRHGVITLIVQDIIDNSLISSYTDDYTENADTGVTLAVVQIDNDSSADGDSIALQYSTDNVGFDGILTYSILHLA
jgi:hypothetical protein